MLIPRWKEFLSSNLKLEANRKLNDFGFFQANSCLCDMIYELNLLLQVFATGVFYSKIRYSDYFLGVHHVVFWHCWFD